MKYVSTRGIDSIGVSSAHAIKTGLAADGGLYIPYEIPKISYEDMYELKDMSYAQRAAKIISKFLTDYTYEELLEDARLAYSEDKFGPHPAPVVKVEKGVYMLELWHGPTSAFKDMALQLMPRLFSRALVKCGEKRCALILVATSGDTGKAALEGYRDVPNTKIKVFYPECGVSRVQKLQMQTQEGENVSVDGIVGNFDDAQSGVKKIFSDTEMITKLDNIGVFLSSANSINWGRLVPQIVYYVSAYSDMVNLGEIALGEQIDVCVPTGNFGNIFAAYIAKLMGLPISKLVCASNSNNVLTDFLNSGVYDKNRPFHQTISPSMDILISSNLERLLFVTLGAEKTREYMEALSTCGRYELSNEDFAAIKENFVGYYTDEETTAKTIRELYLNKNCLTDTHTAVAMNATYAYRACCKTERKILTVSTASPYKFAKDVYASIKGHAPEDDVLALSMLESLTGVPTPAPLKNLSEKPRLHTRVIERDQMEIATAEFAKN